MSLRFGLGSDEPITLRKAGDQLGMTREWVRKLELQALAKMQRTGSSRLLVTDGERLVGIISLKDLLRFLNLKLELEGAPPEDGVAQEPTVETQEEELAGR